MVFSSQSFMFFFLPVAITMGLLVRNRQVFTLYISLVSSVFYLWSGSWIFLILLLCVSQTYFLAILYGKYQKRWLILLSILINVLILIFFKYAYFSYSLVSIFFAVNENLEGFLRDIVLPIGISFYIFQAISYSIDCLRNKAIIEQFYFRFYAYITFFPQLIAGPIIRYVDVRDYFQPRPVNGSLFAYGSVRFAHGLFKKVVIADTVAPVADALFSMDPAAATFYDTLIGSVAYSLQIYFDFSGYSDMAIGIAAMFGISFKENFHRPYSSYSMTDFWRRWHISLSSWFRDYLYIPLGGNHHGIVRTFVNLAIVFLVTGIWHGAALTFIAWGLYNGLFLILERHTLAKWELSTLTRIILRFAYVLPVILIGWILFRSQSIGQFVELTSKLARPFSRDAFVINDLLYVALTPFTTFIIVAGALIYLFPASFNQVSVKRLIEKSPVFARAVIAYTAVGLLVSAVLVLSGNYSPFIYFQF